MDFLDTLGIGSFVTASATLELAVAWAPGSARGWRPATGVRCLEAARFHRPAAVGLTLGGAA
jgi:hypothetical protein